jgi:hypothetical protein
MRTYEGRRTHDGAQVSRRDEQGRERELSPRLDLWNHSPTGFEWGYGGSGPAQLSLALLADALGDDEKAVALHQPFKWAVVGSLPRLTWTLTDQEIQDLAARIEGEAEQRQSGA